MAPMHRLAMWQRQFCIAQCPLSDKRRMSYGVHTDTRGQICVLTLPPLTGLYAIKFKATHWVLNLHNRCHAIKFEKRPSQLLRAHFPWWAHSDPCLWTIERTATSVISTLTCRRIIRCKPPWIWAHISGQKMKIDKAWNAVLPLLQRFNSGCRIVVLNPHFSSGTLNAPRHIAKIFEQIHTGRWILRRLIWAVEWCIWYYCCIPRSFIIAHKCIRAFLYDHSHKSEVLWLRMLQRW